MTAIPKRKLTVEEYLAIEEKAEYKSEFYNGEMFVMAGGTINHQIVAANFMIKTGTELESSSYFIIGSDQRLQVQTTGLYTYPDAMIICGEPEFDPLATTNLLNPKVVIEVMSPSTEEYDLGVKVRHYRTIASVQQLVFIRQDSPEVELMTRQSEDQWLVDVIRGLDAVLNLSSVGVKILLTDLYARITFPEQNSLAGPQS